MLLRRTSRPTAAAWRHIRGLSSWTNATVQEKLNSHPWVADCVVGDAEHIHGVSGNLAHVVPLFQTRGLAGYTETFFSDTEPNAEKNYQESLLRYSNVDADGLNEYLRDGGYEGAALQVLWCTEAQLTNVFFHGYQRHERMVLRDIVYAMFAEADTDGDGSITLAEFAPLCEKYGVDISSFHNADLISSPFDNMESGDDYTLGFAEFKGLMLKQNLISVAGKDGRYMVKEALMDAVARPIFDKADADSDGTISLAEVKAVLEGYNLSDANDDLATVAAFHSMDTDGDGSIDYGEFKAFLISEGVLKLAPQESGGVFASIFRQILA